jgi:lipase chaperone LimK
MNVLPRITYEDKLAELHDTRIGLELRVGFSSYLEHANDFLALATRYLEIDALACYGTCMNRYKHYLDLHKSEADEKVTVLIARQSQIRKSLPKVMDDEVFDELIAELAEIEAALQKEMV